MTVYINLLPHREERRKRARQHFFVLLGASGVLGVVIWFGIHSYHAAKIDTQNDRNTFLKSENAALDKQIAEIKKLKDEIQALLARKQIIETLQTDRAQTVHLLEEMVNQMPEGVYIHELRQKDLGVNLKGYAQSNARVSTLMRNIEASPWLQSPGLVEIKANVVDKRRVSEFNLNMQIKRVTSKEAKEGGKEPAKAAKKG
jgi:type IV pilus assembly protein PilN